MSHWASKLLRACDCAYYPCFHNPGKEHEAAKKRLIEFKGKFDSMPWWKKAWNARSLQAEQAAIIRELERTDWRKKEKQIKAEP
jgi:hypothetical protein